MKEVSLMQGRFQPAMHNGHIAIVKGMKYRPCIAVIEGVGTGKNKTKNPLSGEERFNLITQTLEGLGYKNALIFIVPNGYTPDNIKMIEAQGYKVRDLHAGSDRLEDYKKKIDRANLSLNTDTKISLEYIETKRITSSTEVREAIRMNAFESFKSLMPESIWDQYNFLREKLKQ
jgi:nicotinamide mononucleotide adenylyltransferase